MRLWHNKTLDQVLIDPLLCKNSFIISSSYIHLRNVARKFFYPQQQTGIWRPQAPASYMTSPGQEL